MVVYDPNQANQDLNEFITPKELANAMASLITNHYPTQLPLRVLDAGANTGVLGSAVHRWYPKAFIVGVELMKMPRIPDAYDVYLDSTDFLSNPTLEQLLGIDTFDVVIGNPPYTVNGKSTAEEFVRTGLKYLKFGGLSIQLLRTNFLHSMERYWIDGQERQVPGFWQEFPPKYVYVSVRRPSFYKQDSRTKSYGKANTNAHDYSVFVFAKGWYGEPIIRWLDWDYAGEEATPKYVQLPLPEPGVDVIRDAYNEEIVWVQTATGIWSRK